MTQVGEMASILLACFTIHSAAALAQSTPEAQSQDVIVEGQIPDANKRVCRQMTPTGSILPTRICRTKGEWEEIRRRNIYVLEQIKKDQDRKKVVQCIVMQIC